MDDPIEATKRRLAPEDALPYNYPLAAWGVSLTFGDKSSGLL
jgi:hypothetical protein